MILFPQAKINLGLNVLHKREDGFHELDSCMVPVPFVDVLEILPAEKFSFKSTGLEISGNTEDNLCVKAYQLMVEKYGISPIYMHLRKEIPMGAGIGGGSSDAAAVLKGVNELFNLNLSIEVLEDHASTLGSDCAFFIRNKIQFAKGRGELLSPSNVDLQGYFVKIIYPGIHISTKEAFAGVILQKQLKSIYEIIESPIENWKDELKNDFEPGAFLSHPVLAQIKEKLYVEGAVYASMSGSGSTIYGIYKFEPEISFGGIFFEKIMKM